MIFLIVHSQGTTQGLTTCKGVWLPKHHFNGDKLTVSYTWGNSNTCLQKIALLRSGQAISSTSRVANRVKTDIHLILKLCNSFSSFHAYNKTSFNRTMQLSLGKIHSNKKNTNKFSLVTELQSQQLEQVSCQLLIWQCPKQSHIPPTLQKLKDILYEDVPNCFRLSSIQKYHR